MENQKHVIANRASNRLRQAKNRDKHFVDKLTGTASRYKV